MLRVYGRDRDPDLVEVGKANFAVCSARYADGKGNQQLGALT